MFYSKSTGGFYSTEIHGTNMPDDIVEITNEQHQDLLEKQSQGATIFADNKGRPIAIKPIPPTQQQIMQQAVSAVKVALQAAIDGKAHEFNFSSGNAYMLYAGFANAFQDSALIFAKWEASVWEQADAYKAKVLAGKAPMLSPEEAMDMMPAYPAGNL